MNHLFDQISDTVWFQFVYYLTIILDLREYEICLCDVTDW